MADHAGTGKLSKQPATIPEAQKGRFRADLNQSRITAHFEGSKSYKRRSGQGNNKSDPTPFSRGSQSFQGMKKRPWRRYFDSQSFPSVALFRPETRLPIGHLFGGHLAGFFRINHTLPRLDRLSQHRAVLGPLVEAQDERLQKDGREAHQNPRLAPQPR